MLTRVALKVELPPSHHLLACQRKEAVEKHLETAGSPLEGIVSYFYPQGSMAIGATIKAKWREDGFDIDIVVELNLPRDTPPDRVLDLLYEAMKGEKGSRYFDMVERQSRCVTVHYADGMHLDLTPSIRVGTKPRKSIIFHAKREEPRFLDQTIHSNSWAFAERFKATCPPDMVFAEKYGRLARQFDSGDLLAKADSEDVPAHSSQVGAKLTATRSCT